MPNKLPTDIKCRLTWRDYQARVLTELDRHLDDRRLHCVAPPGAGKTVLGLETVVRLGKAALILSPTTTIRDQWQDRFIENFNCASTDPTALIACGLDGTSPIQSTTYQHLHAASKDAAKLTKQLSRFGTVVLDEAHHLRNEWWKVLQRFVLPCEDIKIVSLTATPPYDISGTEWNRYYDLCGPVDEEISIPELVQSGDLCPHQDYVYLVEPEAKVRALIEKHQRQISEAQKTFLQDDIARMALLGHPWIGARERSLKSISKNIDLYFAQLNCLEAFSTSDSPTMSPRDFELVINDMLDRTNTKYMLTDRERHDLHRRLELPPANHHGHIQLVEKSEIATRIRLSEAKVQAVVDICVKERSTLEKELRCAILTNYIRLDALFERELSVKLGVIPLFLGLAEVSPEPELAVLTGKVVVVPKHLVSHFPAPDQFVPTPRFADYCFAKIGDEHRSQCVRIVTELFEQGKIRVLLGTESLLGEGWDAPCLNTLIMASTTKSFVRSNQVRGRAIRKYGDKIANIWHIAAAVPGALDPGDDYARLRKRFSAFEGICQSGDRITSGPERVDLTHTVPNDLSQFCQNQFAKASDRDQVRARWLESLAPAGTRHLKGRMIEQTLLRQPTTKQRNSSDKVSPSPVSFYGLGAALGACGGWLLEPSLIFHAVIVGSVGLGAIGTIYSTIRTASNNGLFDRPRLRQQAKTLLRALRVKYADKGYFDRAKVEFERSEDSFAIRLVGASHYASDIFHSALREILHPSRNPRYAIVARDFVVPLPDEFRNKKTATLFFSEWKKLHGGGRLVYTDSPEGLELLVKIGLQSRSRRRSERTSLWSAQS